MTEPTQEEIEAAKKYNHRKWGGKLMPTINMISAAYANHVTTTLQAKIDRLEIGMDTLRAIAHEHQPQEAEIVLTKIIEDQKNTIMAYENACRGYRARIATLEAELAARDFVK